jgi:hypothetical protein
MDGWMDGWMDGSKVELYLRLGDSYLICLRAWVRRRDSLSCSMEELYVRLISSHH